MLTLLEPPGAKHVQTLGNRSAQHLLRLNPEDEYFDATDYESSNEITSTSNSITRFLDKYLVWKSSSDEYNGRWKSEFYKQPSWCDADLCLQQIRREDNDYKLRRDRSRYCGQITDRSQLLIDQN
ncbi:hypothetical protein DICVIV_05840 [Dictyocaulus viviparus]|uniref:Uncharacterized protein n=1 Tax=Dictyocaulus viviparus TaxID=29172 RepID=A0A0D8XU47_DICVI|nr:hypothetical protein DICVIV_05840 [Dictyocaulus viviparus]